MASRRGYSRVATSEAGADDGGSGTLSAGAIESHKRVLEEAEKAKRRRRKDLAETVATKLHSILWVGAAGLLIWFTDLLNVVWSDQRINTIALDIALIATGFDLAVLFYLVVYLPYIAKIHLEWNVYCPRAIPAATIAGVIAWLSFGVSIWPIFGLLTPPMLLVLFLGFVFTANLIPALP